MKKTKNYLKILLFSIAFALSSCSKEMYEEPISEQKLQNLKVQKISLRDINSAKIDPLIFTAVNKVKNKQKSENGFNRMIYDPTFDFYYDDENGTLIENGNYKSYTFQVVRPNDDDKVENIVFSKNENGIDFDTYLFKYDFTYQELATQSTMQLSSNAVEIKSLDNNVYYPSLPGDWIETTQGKSVFVPNPCKWVKVTAEHGGGHWECIDGSGGVTILNIPALNPPPVRPPNPAPTPIPAIGTVPVVTNTTTPTGTTATVPTNSNTSTTSSTSSSSSSNSSASSSGTNGASGTTGTGINGTFGTYGTNSAGTGVIFGGSNSGTSIITSPMGGANNSNNEEDPCESLKDSSDDSKVKTAIENLKSKTKGLQEFAYEIERKNSSLGFTYSTKLKIGTNFNTTVDVGGYINSQAHNHPKNGVSIPSWTDIHWTQECSEEIATINVGTAHNIIVVADSSPIPPNPSDPTIVYSIKITNLSQLQSITNAQITNPNIAHLTLAERYNFLTESFGASFRPFINDTAALEQKFLEIFGNYGISFYKKDPLTAKWSRLRLSQPYDPSNPIVNNTIILEPCN